MVPESVTARSVVGGVINVIGDEQWQIERIEEKGCQVPVGRWNAGRVCIVGVTVRVVSRGTGRLDEAEPEAD